MNRKKTAVFMVLIVMTMIFAGCNQQQMDNQNGDRSNQSTTDFVIENIPNIEPYKLCSKEEYQNFVQFTKDTHILMELNEIDSQAHTAQTAANAQNPNNPIETNLSDSMLEVKGLEGSSGFVTWYVVLSENDNVPYGAKYFLSKLQKISNQELVAKIRSKDPNYLRDLLNVVTMYLSYNDIKISENAIIKYVLTDVLIRQTPMEEIEAHYPNRVSYMGIGKLPENADYSTSEVQITDMKLERNRKTSVIHGVLHNLQNKRIDRATIEFVIYDKDGYQISDIITVIYNLAPGAKAKFSETILRENADHYEIVACRVGY